MRPQELTVTALYAKDASDVRQIIMDSLKFYIKKELQTIANLSCRTV